MKKIVILGGGFAGLNAAKTLGNRKEFEVTLIDRRNHHLFQPLLYQVAMAGLSPADIAVPIRTILRKYKNITVLQGSAESIKAPERKVLCDIGEFESSPGSGIAIQIDVEDAVGVTHQIEKLTDMVEDEL